jgi:DNA-binding winged helix-turn-helix (wHTH) protein/TolB-like protein/Tfp pilus assembly protein PilF
LTIQGEPGPAVERGGRAHAGWRVGDIDIDLVQARVTLRGRPVALDRSGYDLLLHLVEHAGDVIGKDDLLRVGWPGRIVSENTLAKAISRLRHAIGDDKGELVRVVHGYGYRLVAEVAMRFAPVPGAAPDTPASPAPPLPRRITWKPAAVAALAIAALATWAWTAREPVRHATATATALVTRPTPGGEDVIAVLPFRDLSANGSLAMLADGFANHVRDYMQGVPRLRIVNRGDSLDWRGDRRDIAAAARGLGANLIVDGDLDWRDGRLHATVRLSDAHGRIPALERSFERPPAEQAALLEDLTAAVALALGDRPDAWRHDPRGGRGTANAEAYQAWLRASTRYAGGRDPNSQRRALVALERAVELDPDFADAWIGLAEIFGDGSAPWADSAEQLRAGRERSLAAFDRGIALGADTPFNLLTRSEVRLLYGHDWHGAWDDIEAAAAKGGETAELLIWQARYAASLGRLDEAIALGGRASALDPQSGARRNQGWHYLGKGDTRSARAVLLLQQPDMPENPHVNFYLALADILDGRPQAALPRLESSSTLFRLVGTAIAQHELGDRAASDVALDKLVGSHALADGYWIAGVHSWRGELDQAFAWLDQAIDRRDSSVPYLKFDPLMKNLRADPRYAQRLARLGVPDDPAFVARAVAPAVQTDAATAKR